MYKTRLNSNRILCTLAVAGAALALVTFLPANASAAGKTKSTVAPAQKVQGEGHLMIKRSANLGAYAVGLSVDGVQTATINYNGHYDAPLAAGKHVLSVIPIPNRMAGKARETQLTVEAGKTYSFTAKRDNDDYVLK